MRGGREEEEVGAEGDCGEREGEGDLKLSLMLRLSEFLHSLIVHTVLCVARGREGQRERIWYCRA